MKSLKASIFVINIAYLGGMNNVLDNKGPSSQKCWQPHNKTQTLLQNMSLFKAYGNTAYGSD